jgi:hypothetical protein
LVIAPIGDDGSDVREHSDTVLECIMDPVITTMDFEEGKRADHRGEPGVVTHQIIERIAKGQHQASEEVDVVEVNW